MVRISIVTVTFNSAKTLAKAIESVLNQTYPPHEYIVVDGASTDRTVAVAESYQSLFDSKGITYQIISEPDKGIYDAMNKGIAMSTGDLVGMINSDDWYEPEAIQVVSQAYMDKPFDWFYADVRIIKATGSFIKQSRHDVFPSTRHWNHPTTFISREVYLLHRYETRDILEDWDLMLRLRRAGYKPQIVNATLANFVFGGCSNKKGLAETWERAKLKYNVYRRNGYSRWYIIECAIMELAKYVWG